MANELFNPANILSSTSNFHDQLYYAACEYERNDLIHTFRFIFLSLITGSWTIRQSHISCVVSCALLNFAAKCFSGREDEGEGNFIFSPNAFCNLLIFCLVFFQISTVSHRMRCHNQYVDQSRPPVRSVGRPHPCPKGGQGNTDCIRNLPPFLGRRQG